VSLVGEVNAIKSEVFAIRNAIRRMEKNMVAAPKQAPEMPILTHKYVALYRTLYQVHKYKPIMFSQNKEIYSMHKARPIRDQLEKLCRMGYVETIKKQVGTVTGDNIIGIVIKEAFVDYLRK
jgi:hypothetical protein